MNKEFERFLSMEGSTNKAAEVMECKEAMIRHIKMGRRGVSKVMARKIVERYPELSLWALLYGDSDE